MTMPRMAQAVSDNTILVSERNQRRGAGLSRSAGANTLSCRLKSCHRKIGG